MDYASVLRYILLIISTLYAVMIIVRGMDPEGADNGHLKERDHFFPADLIDRITVFGIFFRIGYLHETVAFGKLLLVKVAGVLLEVDHLYLTAVPAHEEEYVSAVRVTVELVLDNLHQPVVTAAHVRYSRDVIEVMKSVDRQHRPSSFNMNCFSSG